MPDHADPVADRHECANWTELVPHLDAFPSPTLGLGEEGQVLSSRWVFRGLADSYYRLEPAIEREARERATGWAVLELLVSGEFRSRSHMHLGASAMPKDDLTWLALMQHYAIPTRLLDFSYSPFVALYFAIRSGVSPSGSVRLWAIDAQAVNDRFRKVAWQAREEAEDKERQKAGIPLKARAANIGDLDNFFTNRDSLEHETEGLAATIASALTARWTQRRVQQDRGCVCVATPPSFNPRLASQQGVFILNCAEELSFRQSLTRMMGKQRNWCRTFDIPVRALPEIEERLFQRNIHEQSLFPDMEGLAGLIRQKIKLHWK